MKETNNCTHPNGHQFAVGEELIERENCIHCGKTKEEAYLVERSSRSFGSTCIKCSNCGKKNPNIHYAKCANTVRKMKGGIRQLILELEGKENMSIPSLINRLESIITEKV